MAANLGPLSKRWQLLDRPRLEALIVTSPYPRARHRQVATVDLMEDYLHISGPDLPNDVAARRLGVHPGTVERLRRRLRQATS